MRNDNQTSLQSGYGNNPEPTRKWLDFFDTEQSIIIIALIVLFLLALGLFLLVSFVVRQIENIGARIVTWDVAIIAVIIGGLLSILHLLISNWLEKRSQKHLLKYNKQIQTYENIVSFVFKYQKREGYTPISTPEEAQMACFSINQQVMLWGSKEIQRAWQHYLVESWGKDNNSYQHNAVVLFSKIADEVGQRFKRDSLYDCPPLVLFYDIPSFTITIPNLKTNEEDNGNNHT